LTEQPDALGVALDRHDDRRRADARERARERLLGRRARDDRDALALQLVEARQVRLVAHEHRAAVDVDRHAEVDRGHARERDRRRAALEVDLAVRDRLDPVGGGQRAPLDLDRVDAGRLADLGGRLLAQLDRVAAHAAVAVLVRERGGVVAVAHQDRAGDLDTVERRSCERRSRHGEAAERECNEPDSGRQSHGIRRGAKARRGECSIPSRPLATAGRPLSPTFHGAALIRPLRRIVPILIAAALAAPLPALAQGGLPDTLGRIKAAGQINVAYSPDSIPFSQVDGGQPVGYSIDLCRGVIAGIARAVGNADLKVNWIPRHGQRASRGREVGPRAPRLREHDRDGLAHGRRRLLEPRVHRQRRASWCEATARSRASTCSRARRSR
jgi:hypothetical protein